MTRSTWKPQLFLLALVLVSCQRGEGVGDVILHPTPNNIPIVTDPGFIIHDEPADTLEWLSAALREGHQIGVEDGASDKMIGQIWDVAIGGDLAYYVDYSYNFVRVYDFEGQLVDIIGSSGDGPGEFRFTTYVSVANADDDVHVVVGFSGHKVSVFSRSRNGEHVFQTTFRAVVPFLNGDLCAMQGHVYTTGYSEEINGVIHKHTLEGEYVSSFGMRYNHHNPFIRSQMTEGGSIECNATHHTLLYVHPYAPIATAFDESGDVSWQIKFSDARIAPKQETIKSPGISSVMALPPKVGESWGLSIVKGARGDSFWLSRRERQSKERDRMADHFYQVNVLSGRGEYIGIRPINLLLREESKKSVRAVDHERIYTTQSRPFPQLGIHPIPNEPR
ncbi:MAG: hypothetical protein OXH03_00970 [Bacteroidetes bacterium]|nr:hypothetical protein [Bacteroidota bacterium]MDE2672735.1 hypothetical protein [Bacteroidota bacterium]